MTRPTMEATPASTVTGGYVAAIIHAAQARGAPADALLRAADLAAIPGNDPTDRVPVESVGRLFDAAVETTGDPYFGLFAANYLHAGNFHALGYALLASSSLRDFAQRLCRYFGLLSTTSTPTVVETDTVARLEFRLRAPSPNLTDDTFGLFLVRLIGELSDGVVRPVHAELHRPTPPDGGFRHVQTFGCPITFGTRSSAFIFDRSALDVPMAAASRELAEHNERIATTYLAKLERSDIRTRVRALLLRDLSTGAVTKEQIAAKLCMSPRTLQVKLAQCETSFHDIVNETREALARGYIESSVMSVTEIAFTLGFADTSAFSRAFRRWTGRSPRGYLAEIRGDSFPNRAPAPAGNAGQST
jgi:AraC-like DNA-binding protein